MTRHLSAAQAAAALGVKTATLATWRREGKGPKGHFHLTKTLVVYPTESVQAYLAERKRTDSDD